MRGILGMLPLLLLAWALEASPAPSLELRLTASLSFSLFPQAVVVERFPEPQGLVVVYRYAQAEAIFRHHDEDLRRRGWVRVKYEVKKGEWKAEYKKGKAKAKLSVKDKKGRVEVRLKEGD
ncbi:hypothetical protein [Thermus amyloliquefaciens]|uniref:hypothetical protein n=1 Tax=Thermus amyloliquefaciens TaxID=1449080 RepID=UPI0005708EFF|nr:hypothetical protein [Thermus amyloliquefaciens]